MLASWIRMLYMSRVYANILIGPRIIQSCPWKGSTIAHSFCFRTTSSESFDFIQSLQLANKCIYQTFLLSICMYQQFPLDPTCDRNQSVPSYCVGLLEEATRKFQDLVHIMQRAWSRFLKAKLGVTSTPTELEFNYNKPVRISHIYFHLFKQHEYFITCIYVYSV